MKARLNRDKSTLMEEILNNPECMWENDTSEIMRKYTISQQELMGSKYKTKNNVKRAIALKKKTLIEQVCQGKSKMKHFLENKEEWNVGQRAKYMNELTRNETSLIFKARTRMFKVKGNYKNGYQDLKCRMCKREEETQKHILEECLAMHNEESIRVPNHQLFNEDTGTLKNVAKNLEKIQNKLYELA